MAPRRTLAAASAAALVAAAAYAPTIGHGFVFDDGPEVVDNDLIRSLGNLPRIFATSAWTGAGEENPIYRPLTTATFALDYAARGLAPAGYHLANVLLHALASALVAVLALRLGLPLAAAAFAGVLFGVHPVHVEAVANVAGRKDVLATLFALSAVLAHGRARRLGGAWLVAAPAALAAAMLSKETGAAALGLVAARDLLFDREAWRGERRRALALYATYATVLGLYLLARRAAVGSVGVPLDHIPFTENPLVHATWPVRVATAIAVLGRGVGLLVLPLHLSPDYSYAAIPPLATAADPWLLLGLAAIAGSIAVAILVRRSWPVGPFAVAWYGLAILPGSNLLFPVGTVFGERLLYLPSVGFCLAAGALAGWALEPAAGRRAVRSAARWALASVAVALAARTLAYERHWSDELALFTEGVRAQPASSKMRQCLGGALMERDRAAEAVPHFERQIEILRGTPASLSRPRLELGVAYERLGRLEEAAATYGEILREEPRSADALWRLGVVRWAQGRRGDAVASWLEAVAADPSHARALSDLGIARLAEGDRAGARAYWLLATRADPRLASVWYRLGNLSEREGDLATARAAWAEFLRRDHGKSPREEAEVRRKLGDSAGR